MIMTFTVLVLLLLMSSLFSATETAFTSLSMLKIRELILKNSKSGKKVEKMMEKPEILLTTILIGNNLVNIAASSLATLVTVNLFGNYALGASTGILTLLILIFAEVTPKQIAINRCGEIAMVAVVPVQVLSWVFRPFIWIINLVSNRITRLFARKKADQISLEGLLHMMTVANAQGVVEDYEQDLVKGVFRFNDVTAGAIMTHRTEVFSLDQSISLKKALPLIHNSGFSRVPIYKDNSEQITGVILASDAASTLLTGGEQLKLKEIARDAIFVPENRKLNKLFHQFKKEHLNLAVVLDEYGGLAGIVSREDAIEELMGELWDENESVESEKISKAGKALYRIQGDTSLHQVHDILDIKLDYNKNFQTIAGYMVEILDRFPQEGETISVPGAEFTAEKVGKNRIKTLICKIVPIDENKEN